MSLPSLFKFSSIQVPEVNSIFPTCKFVRATTDSVFKRLRVFLLSTKKSLDDAKTQSEHRDKLEKNDQPTDA